MKKPDKEKLKKIVTEVNDFLKRVSRGRYLLERLWFHSILFERGIQWISFDDLRGTFTKSNTNKAIPRPVTNKYAEAGASLVSNLLNFEPRVTFAPQTSRPDDMQSAMRSNLIIKSIENEVNWFQLRTEAKPWVVYTGNVFYVLGFDPDQGKIVQMQKLSCINSLYGGECTYSEDVPLEEDVSQKVCPECTPKAQSPVPLTPHMEGGEVVVENKRQGAMVGEVVNPFEIFFDYGQSTFDESPMVARIHAKTPMWVKEKYNVNVEVVPGQRRQELNARFRCGLKNFIPTGEETPVDTVDVVEVWCRPSKKYNKGFYMVIVGEDHVVHYEDYKWISREGKVFIPIIHEFYHRTPGSAYGKTPMFDVIEKQVMRNKVEALGEMYLNRMSNPVWLIPRGTETDPSGNVGHQIHFDPNATQKLYPKRDEAPSMSFGITEWMDRIDADIYRIIGSSEISRGERPKSLKTGYGIEKLEEVAKARQSAQFSNITIAAVKVMIVMLEIFRIVSPKERYAKVFGVQAGWSVKKIQEADLQGGVDIWAEPGGTLPKTPLERQAQLDLFIQSGLVNLADPMNVYRIFLMYGMEDLAPDVSVDLTQIAREHDRFFQEKQPIVRHPWDNDQLHILMHKQAMKDEQFEEIPEPMQQYFMLHVQEHELYLQQALLAQQQAQQGGEAQNDGASQRGS